MLRMNSARLLNVNLRAAALPLMNDKFAQLKRDYAPRDILRDNNIPST